MIKITLLAATLLLVTPVGAFGKGGSALNAAGLPAQSRLIDMQQPDCDKMRADELACLACNVYHEARSEGRDGRRLVAKITMNRVGSPKFPDTICAVVWQRQGGRGQFSWTSDGRPDIVLEPQAWREAVETAALMIRDHYDPRFTLPIGGRIEVADSLWFHNHSVRPGWTARLEMVGRVGNHLVYRPRGG